MAGIKQKGKLDKLKRGLTPEQLAYMLATWGGSDTDWEVFERMADAGIKKRKIKVCLQVLKQFPEL